MNHFLGAALFRKDVNEEEDGDGAGGKDMFEADGLMFGSTWSGWEFFRALVGILSEPFHVCKRACRLETLEDNEVASL